MIVRAVEIQVKPERLEEFIPATLANRRGSIGEPGVLRFDVLQSEQDSSRFLLYEVYRDLAATEAHKQTAHYQAWRQAVEPMMASPRQGQAYQVLAPADAAEW